MLAETSRMLNPPTIIAFLLCAVLGATVLWRPRYAFLPSLLLFAFASMTLWGMTNAMPRATVSNIPDAKTAEYSEAFYEGAKALAKRQADYASNILWGCMALMSASIVTLSLRKGQRSQQSVERPNEKQG
jgi:hypothetical protein